MGNIQKDSLSHIFGHNRFASEVAACNACWMICTTKSMMEKRLIWLVPQVAPEVVKAAFRHLSG